jgi:hypothetical protein
VSADADARFALSGPTDKIMPKSHSLPLIQPQPAAGGMHVRDRAA